jgi:hypothetical protein
MLKKAYVLSVLRNPYEDNFSIFEDAIKKAGLELGIKDIKNPNISSLSEIEISNFIQNLPSGSLLAKTSFDSKDELIICLPAISSHLQLPIKSSEYVWYFQDTSEYKIKNSFQIVKCFWLSRIHGLNISEDTNFSFHDRDFQKNLATNKIDIGIDKNTKKARQKKENKIKESNSLNKTFLPYFSSLDAATKKEKSNIQVEDLVKYNLENSSNNRSFSFKAVPRFYDSCLSTTIQGSYNSLVNLGKSTGNANDSGTVDIIAGRIALENKVYQQEKIETQSFSVSDLNKNELDEEVSFVYNDKFKFYKIKNSIGYEENLKDSSAYIFQKNIVNHSKKEFLTDADADASRIYVCESDNLDNQFIKTNLYKNQENIITSTYLSDKKNYKNEGFESYGKSYPGILCKSNHIRIVARKTYENTELDSSSIRIIKEGKDYKEYSHILLENNGNILLDGNKILIGSLSRNAYEKNNITLEELNKVNDPNNSNSSALDTINKKISNLTHEDASIILGSSESFSEPLVLGHTLVQILSDIISQQNLIIDSLSNLCNKLNSHNHDIIVPTPNTPTTTMSLSKLGPFSNLDVINSEIQKYKSNLTRIKDNELKTILSKISKTS